MAEQEKKKWAIFYGTVNEAEMEIVEDEMSEYDANLYAWRQAMEDYENYEGMYGLRTMEEIMEEDELEEEDASQVYEDEKESWLNYWVEEYDPTKHDD